jgi:hypothetical protein
MKARLCFQSPSSADIKHDASNLLVEFIMINKYGILAPYAWRKGQPLAGEWGQICQKIRRLLNTLKIDAGRLGWYIWTTKAARLDYNEFGLVRWKINKYFPFGNLHEIAIKYRLQIERAQKALEHDEHFQNIQYITKEAGTTTKKSLLDLIEEFEHGARK